MPLGYFHGSMIGLQVDMAVFRDVMAEKLPKLSKHLLKLQELHKIMNDPPLTNVFTMQWFLTLFCNYLPYNCVLRIWDLILLEGSEILIKCALVIWSILEPKLLTIQSADDFYSKMAEFSRQLLNGTFFDSNNLVQKIASIGTISNLAELRRHHRKKLVFSKNNRYATFLTSLTVLVQIDFFFQFGTNI